MTTWNRRQLLATAGAAGAALTVGACSPQDPTGSGGSSTLEWWDHYNALQDLHRSMLKDFSEGPDGIPVKYQFMQLAKFAKSIQLAKQSRQQPDVHSIPQLGSPLMLIEGGWFQPMELSDEVMANLGEDTLVDGVHRFDGKVYTFPLFSPRWHNAVLWYQKSLLEKIDVAPPTTFDELRAACRKAARADGEFTGLVAGLKSKNPYFLVLDTLAQLAGFPGIDGHEFTTGEIRYHHDAYLEVFELLDAIRTDKALFPAASSVAAIQARLRWASGEGVFWFEGPFAVGAVNKDAPEVLDQMDMAGLVTPSGSGGQAYRPRAGGAFYLKKDSPVAEAANQLLGEFTTTEYYRNLAGAMDQPPPDLATVEESPDAHPLYKKLCRLFDETSFLAPMPVVANPQIAHVNAEAENPQRRLGDIFAGMVSGDITDYRKALTELSGQVAKERDRALAKVSASGAEVSLDDYVFANWTPGADYGTAQYGAR